MGGSIVLLLSLALWHYRATLTRWIVTPSQIPLPGLSEIKEKEPIGLMEQNVESSPQKVVDFSSIYADDEDTSQKEAFYAVNVH